jgi:hypothetical protein
MLVKAGNDFVEAIAVVNANGSTSDEITTYVLLDAVLINTTSAKQVLPKGKRLLQADIAGTGAVSATVTWYGQQRLDGPVEVAAIMSLSGTTTDKYFYEQTVEWPIMYCATTAISGTDAAVSATVSV